MPSVRGYPLRSRSAILPMQSKSSSPRKGRAWRKKKGSQRDAHPSLPTASTSPPRLKPPSSGQSDRRCRSTCLPQGGVPWACPSGGPRPRAWHGPGAGPRPRRRGPSPRRRGSRRPLPRTGGRPPRRRSGPPGIPPRPGRPSWRPASQGPRTSSTPRSPRRSPAGLWRRGRPRGARAPWWSRPAPPVPGSRPSPAWRSRPSAEGTRSRSLLARPPWRCRAWPRRPPGPGQARGRPSRGARRGRSARATGRRRWPG
mmetsp:Transcript_119443/g.372102  ORF Transcript_119443/g.372102 Transcript_119443/m.372102 type:complete len:255 (+) Transcript_119443:78-842(+)